MLKITELKQGDIISVDDEGVRREGIVMAISYDENQAFVNNGIQEFWYDPQELHSVPLDEEQLTKLGFLKEETDESVKYKKDSFRLTTNKKGDFSNLEMWWREDKRHFNFPIGVHHLQNLHLSMTKRRLEKA